MSVGRSGIVAESARVRLRPTTPADVDFVLGAEADPDNAGFILRWRREDHLGAIEDETRAHWMVEDAADGDAVGYVILSALGSPHQSIEFNRITIVRKGEGYGRETLRLVKRVMFEQHGAHRLWLDVMIHNRRAHQLYLSEGFVEEGRLRECLLIDGRRITLVVLSMLRGEYEQTAGRSA